MIEDRSKQARWCGDDLAAAWRRGGVGSDVAGRAAEDLVAISGMVFSGGTTVTTTIASNHFFHDMIGI